MAEDNAVRITGRTRPGVACTYTDDDEVCLTVEIGVVADSGTADFGVSICSVDETREHATLRDMIARGMAVVVTTPGNRGLTLSRAEAEVVVRAFAKIAEEWGSAGFDADMIKLAQLLIGVFGFNPDDYDSYSQPSLREAIEELTGE